MGFKKPDKITATLGLSSVKVKIGETLALQGVLKNASGQQQALLVDYVVFYQGKQGAERAKVFKWKALDLAAGESTEINKTHSMRLTSIRALYPGNHRVELQVNGVIVASKQFNLTA